MDAVSGRVRVWTPFGARMRSLIVCEDVVNQGERIGLLG